MNMHGLSDCKIKNVMLMMITNDIKLFVLNELMIQYQSYKFDNDILLDYKYISDNCGKTAILYHESLNVKKLAVTSDLNDTNKDDTFITSILVNDKIIINAAYQSPNGRIHEKMYFFFF